MDHLRRRLRDKHLLTGKLLQRLESQSRFMEALLGPDAGDHSFEHHRDLTPSQVGALRGQLDETRQLVSFLSMTLDGQWRQRQDFVFSSGFSCHHDSYECSKTLKVFRIYLGVE